MPGFGMVIIFATFEGIGKCDIRIQWLHKCVKCTKGLLGRCLRHSLGMQSIPQPFLSFSDFINFSMPHGLIMIGGFSSTGSSRAWTPGSTRHSWSSSQKPFGVNGFSKQSAIAFVLSVG
jgi:hypothetical protein